MSQGRIDAAKAELMRLEDIAPFGEDTIAAGLAIASALNDPALVARYQARQPQPKPGR